MQTIMDAASHIAEEIERTRLHLANLEQALQGLKPLMTIDVSSTTLFYSQVDDAQPVEDAFIVNVAKPTAKAAKAAKAGTAASNTPADKSAAKAAPQTKVKAKAKVASAPKPAAPAVNSAGLPVTGAAFWMALVGRKAFSSSELTQAALEKLSLDTSVKNVMANRARAWITASLKKGVLVADGVRQGVYFYKLA